MEFGLSSLPCAREGGLMLRCSALDGKSMLRIEVFTFELVVKYIMDMDFFKVEVSGERFRFERYLACSVCTVHHVCAST